MVSIDASELWCWRRLEKGIRCARPQGRAFTAPGSGTGTLDNTTLVRRLVSLLPVPLCLLALTS